MSHSCNRNTQNPVTLFLPLTATSFFPELLWLDLSFQKLSISKGFPEPTQVDWIQHLSGFFLFLFFLTNFCLHSALQPFLFPPSIFYSVHVWLFVTLRAVAHQAPLSLRFPRQEYWSGLPFPTLRDLPDPGIKPESLALAGGFFTIEPPGKL